MMTSTESTQAGQPETVFTLSSILHTLGYLSILASIGVWYFASASGSPEAIAHGERFGIFVGLWAPTLFILSDKYARKIS